MNQLGLFAKFWQPGMVKTRLAASIGDVASCNLYQSFVSHLLKQLSNSADERAVVFTPTEREADFREAIHSDWNLIPQLSGDLGFRMKSYFAQQFESANADQIKRVGVIGADSPQLGPDLVELAFKKLDEAPVVIGPSSDGGYYLIAMRDRCFEVFEDVQWSTGTVLESTIAKLESQSVAYQLLPELTDVDELESLVALEASLSDARALNSNHGIRTSEATLLQLIRKTISDYELTQGDRSLGTSELS